jgi:hypothetical protein
VDIIDGSDNVPFGNDQDADGDVRLIDDRRQHRLPEDLERYTEVRAIGMGVIAAAILLIRFASLDYVRIQLLLFPRNVRFH